MIPENEQRRLVRVKELYQLERDGDEEFDCIAALAARLFKAPIALISIVDEKRQWFCARVGITTHETPRHHSFCAHAILGDELFEVCDARLDARFHKNPLVLGEPQIRYYAGIPLWTDDGLALGSLCIIDDQPRPPMEPEERALLQTLAQLAMKRINSLRAINYIDSPTGLLNRLRLQEDVQRLLDTGEQPMWLVAADVVSPVFLNEIVKALGYVFSTELMLRIKERLQLLMPPATPLYKLSPTRFAFILRGDDAESRRATALFSTILEAFREEVVCDNIPIRTQLGLGVLRMRPQGEGRADWLRCLISTADHARATGTGWRFYSEKRDRAQLRAFGLLNALPTALKSEDQLSLHYQPKLDLRSGECTSVEALLRWTHPTLGEVSPMEFIPLAEKTALIRPISLWVMNQGLRQIAEWRRQGWQFGLALNISALDLEDEAFVDHLFPLLDHYGVEPEQLELELTESTLMKRPEMVKTQLERLVARGIHLAIDDFGAGYSNWAYLREIAARSLKLDQSFARSLDSSERSREIVKTMIQLARSLGYRVVAEGIENESTYRLLREWQCDEGQGYYLALPMPADDLIAWLNAHQQRNE